MSRQPSPFTNRHKLNISSPAAREVSLGQICEDLLLGYNAAVADLIALRASVNSGMFSTPALAIKAGSSTLAKAVNAFAASAGGVVVTKPVNTDMAALVGTLATANSAAWAFYIDAAGVITSSTKTADSANAAAALALLPAPPAGKAMIGFITIDNASGSNFVGGTTALDAASITTTYYNSVGPTPFAAALTAAVVTTLDQR